MIALKAYLGFSLLFIGGFYIEKTDENYLLIEKNKSFTYKIEPTRRTNNNLQMPGKELYGEYCIQCHGSNGKGDGQNVPPLAGSDWLSKKRTQSIHAVKFGLTGEIVVNNKKYNNVMSSLGLSNKEIADVMNYVMSSWGNKKIKSVTEKEVEKVAK
jgi:mono/diheme cytochrome c family protein